jgi:hypothetical protein
MSPIGALILLSASGSKSQILLKLLPIGRQRAEWPVLGSLSRGSEFTGSRDALMASRSKYGNYA